MRRTAVRHAIVIVGAVLSGLLAGETGAAFQNPDGVAVIIGNRAYKYDVPQVTYAHRDAEAFRRYVVDVLGFDPENVIHQKDADKATMERVFGNRDSLKGSELWRHLHEDGNSDVVVFYSGHGIPGLNDKRGYLLPVNAHPDTAELNGYPIDVLYDNLVKLKEQKAVRSVHVFLDACFSGDSGGGRLIGSTSAIRVAPLNDRMKSDRDSVLMFKNEAPVQKEKDDKSLRGYYKEFFRPFIDHSNPKIDYDKLLRMFYRSFADTFNPKLEYGEFVERVYRHSVEDPSFPEMMAQDLWKLYRDSISRDVFEKLIGLAPKHDHRDGRVEEAWQIESDGLEKLTILTAASGKEVASWDKTAQHGLFTHHLLNALYGGGDADADGQVTAAEAKAYLDWHMTRAARRLFGRVQNVDLRGVETAVLARAVGGMFPVRPLIGQATQTGHRFRDCPTCPEMVVVPAGSYEMGSPISEVGRLEEEGPVHRVTIAQPFAVGVYEVTRGEFGRFVETTGYSTGNSCGTFQNVKKSRRPGRHWRNPGFPQTDQHPVVCVSWEDAQAYVRWLSQETGQRYRLLSETEWEYVARAGTRTARYWGQGWSGQCRYANGWDKALMRRDASFKRYTERLLEVLESKAVFSDLLREAWVSPVDCDDGYAWTSPVGVYEANAFGLHDVLGNVWEAVQDCSNDSYVSASSDGDAWESGNCERHVSRGGSWNVDPRDLRSANRGRDVTGDRFDNIGFRVARTLSDTAATLQAAGQQQEAEARQQAEEARQKPELKKSLLASLKQQMVHIEGGAFRMGCTEEQGTCGADEKPVHRVRVRRFALSKYEVTQALWEVVMGENPSRFENCALCPVENVSWEDIQTFLKKLNSLTGERYRLPTEAEWEYAARGGQQSRGYQYAGSNEPDSVAWYRKNSGDRLHPVGEKQPNELGLYDMSGNVLEWVEDCWNESYSGAPSDGRAWQSGDCALRVLRGGSWSSDPQDLRSASASGMFTDIRSGNFGFRVARTCPASHFC